MKLNLLGFSDHVVSKLNLLGISKNVITIM